VECDPHPRCRTTIPAWRTQALYDEPFMVAVPKGHPWKGEAITSDRAREESLTAAREGHCFRSVLEICHS